MSKEKISVAVIDKGGRGHVLVEQYAKSPDVERVFAIPGNDLMQATCTKQVVTHPTITTTDITHILEICKKNDVSLVDVAQDNAVAIGLVNALSEVGIASVGPTREAGIIEWDKVWARDFMSRHHIPQPEFAHFATTESGIRYLRSHVDQPWFVKASGLAEGKGALPAENNYQAQERVLELQRFGKSGETYLLEQWVKGEDDKLAEEFSAFALCDGANFSIIGYAQDYKRALDGNAGENTGGMGCITPPSLIDSNIVAQVNEIFNKTVQGLAQEGRPYKGVLYLGGMIGTNKKVFVVEFNARWGDPEAQILVPSIQNDFIVLSKAISQGNVTSIPIQTNGKRRVVLAGTAKGYPQDYNSVKGKRIFGLENAINAPQVLVYGAGIKRIGCDWVVDGGRVFYIVGEGETVQEAKALAYATMNTIEIEGDNLHYRQDIADDEIKRLTRNQEDFVRI
ncbi:MAG: phosphoribosylamine--glycine ligase [Candidatus Woesebacteria bacterium]